MFKKITRYEYIHMCRDKNYIATRDLCQLVPELNFSEDLAIEDFTKKHEDSRMGRIVIHDENGLTKNCIYLRKAA